MRSAVLVLTAAFWLSAASAGPYDEAGPSIIRIHVEGILTESAAKAEMKRDHYYQDDATGFIVSPDGLVMTAGHVVPNPTRFESGTLTIEGFFPDLVDRSYVIGESRSALTIVKAAGMPHDAGLLKIQDGSTLRPYLRLCDEYHVDEELVLLSYISSLGNTVLASYHGQVASPSFNKGPVVMDLSTNKGDSGGPVFNSKGRVFAITLGPPENNLERIANTTYGEVMRNAIAAMSPETLALIGTSYDPICDKTLLPPVGPVADVKFDQPFSVELSYGQSTKLTEEFQAPAGSVFNKIDYTDVKSDSERIVATPSSSTIMNDGRTLHVEVSANAPKRLADAFWDTLSPSKRPPVRASINSQVTATIKPARALVASGPIQEEVRSYFVSNTLDTHAATATRQAYTREIPAPAGYRFQQVLGVNVASASHSPTNGVEAVIAAKGSLIRATYSLESGPVENPWKAWIDAFIIAKLVPADKR
jgi:serine protease Do